MTWRPVRQWNLVYGCRVEAAVNTRKDWPLGFSTKLKRVVAASSEVTVVRDS